MSGPTPDTSPLPRWATSLTTFALITGALIFVAWAKMETVQITYDIDDLIDQESALAEEQRRMRAELAELRSPRQLEAIAETLELVPPKPGQVVVIEDAAADVVDPDQEPAE